MGADGIRISNPALPVVTQPPAEQPAPPPSNTPTLQPRIPDAFAPAGSQPQGLDLSGEGSASASLEVSADGISVEGEAGVALTGPRGIGASFQVSGAASVQSDVVSEGGYTTFTVTTDVSVTVSGEVDVGALGFGAEQTEGVEVSYQVRMTDEDYQRMQSGEIPPPDPFHPETMPEGSSIVMNSTDYENSGFSASFHQIGLDSNVRTEEGTSVMIEARPGNQITVTAGPTQAVENSWQLGLDLGLASAHIGNSTELSGFTFNTATYDLDSPEGMAAYNELLVSGSFPEDNGTGITDVAQIQQLDYSSTTSIGGSLGPFEGSVDLNSSHLTQVVTTFPDGTYTQVSDFNLFNGVPVHLEQTFNADGTEDPSQLQFTLNLTDVHPESGALLHQAFTGQPMNMEQFAGDKDLLVTFTADQAQALADRAAAYIEEYPERTGFSWEPLRNPFTYFMDNLSQAADAAAVATVFSDGLNAGPLGEELLGLVNETGGHPLEGAVEVR